MGQVKDRSGIDWKKRGVAVALAGAILASAPAAVRVASGPATISASAVSVSAVGPGALSQSVSAVTLPSAPALPSAAIPDAVKGAADAQKRLNIGPVLNWIRSAAPWVWNAMVNAVRWGWSAFINWWNGLASWIRNTISWFIGGSLWDFYLELRRYFFGW